jgi:hypothetical protein
VGGGVDDGLAARGLGGPSGAEGPPRCFEGDEVRGRARYRGRAGGERGQAMVEFVIVLPILCMLLFGIVQFGITFNHYLTLTDSVRAGSSLLGLGSQAERSHSHRHVELGARRRCDGYGEISLLDKHHGSRRSLRAVIELNYRAGRMRESAASPRGARRATSTNPALSITHESFRNMRPTKQGETRAN